MPEIPPMNEMLSWLIDAKRAAERQCADLYNQMEQVRARAAILDDAIDQAEKLGAVR